MKLSTLRPRVIGAREVKINPQLVEDGYLEKIVKYIPAEIVAAYTTLRGFLIPDVEDSSTPRLPYGEDPQYFGLIFFGCLVLTPLYKYYALRNKNYSTPTFQIVVSTLAFAIWVFAFGDYFEINFPEKYDHLLASIILIFFTLIVPLLEKIFHKP